MNKVFNKLESVIGKENLLRVARTSGFTSRKTSKISMDVFLDLVILLYQDHKMDSLEDLCCKLLHKYDITISKQGLDERFNGAAADYLEAILIQLFEIQLHFTPIDHPVFNNFSKVTIKDSTEFGGGSKNKGTYGGFNSRGTDSTFQIQLEIDLKTGKVNDLLLTSALNSDQADSINTLDNIKKGELIIRDLGYVSFAFMNAVNERNAYYLNKIRICVKLFNTTGEVISYTSIVKGMRKSSLQICEIDCLVGNQNNHIGRAIITLVPEKVYKTRIKELQNKRNRKPITKEDKCRQMINILVTNAPAELLPMAVAVDLYRLRWQLEIQFKAWKSIDNISSLKNTKTARTECYLLGKLIWHMIVNQLKILYQTCKELEEGISTIKLFKVLSQARNKITKVTGNEIKRIFEHLLDIPEKWIEREIKNTNKNSIIF